MQKSNEFWAPTASTSGRGGDPQTVDWGHMVTVQILTQTHLTSDEARDLIPRSALDHNTVMDAAAELVEDVRRDGEAALRRHAERFDGGAPEQLRVPRDVMDDALAALDPELRAAIDVSIERVRSGSAAQVPASTRTQIAPGAVIDQHWVPVERVGLYVPGGKAVYPSSVIMNVVAAQAAGVESIAVVSPPQRDHNGSVHPTILAVAAILGVDEVYAIGGAGAIGALAYGVPEMGLRSVQVISGPGNMFVAAAKRVVSGVVGIDSEAGPTEILIIADDSANPDFVAADLISQAEHDEAASAVLITDSLDFATAVNDHIESRVQTTGHADRVRVALAGEQSRILVVPNLDVAMTLSDAYGAEHLEIHTRDAADRAALVKHAGAIFVGSYTPVSLGDYLAGSNHVLPTHGHARHSAALGAYTFLRPRQTVTYTEDALAEVADSIVTFAQAENLPAHGDAVIARSRK